MPKHKPLIFLASRSPRRRELLKEAQIPFRVVWSYFKERTFPGGPAKTVIANALGKAKHAKTNAKSGLILGADTIVYFKSRILGKPKSKKEARQMLYSLSGTTHSVYTGLALYCLGNKSWQTACVKSRVKMRKFTKAEIRRYLSKVNPLDKAGGYAIQQHGDQLVRKIEGSYTNVVGLPIEKLKVMIAQTVIGIKNKAK